MSSGTASNTRSGIEGTGRLLEDRIVVVTGGSSGIGQAICLRAAAHGAAGIVVADLNEEDRGSGEGPGPTTVELLSAYPQVSTKFVRTDVSHPDQFGPVIAAAEELGGVDVMVNNAGISHRVDFLEVDQEQLRRLMAVNFEGVFFGSQAAARSMVELGKKGSIVNFSSVGGMRGFGHATTYTASKGAVRAFTYALADAVAPYGIRANAIHPGQVETEMLRREMEGGSPIRIPAGRKGTPEEVANAVVFLASGMADYVNGASLVVDGGYSAII